MKVDLHTHTSASDGELSAASLIQRAEAAGIEMLAITDHDTVAAYSDNGKLMLKTGRLITGIEFSSQWKKTGVHIVGLNISLESDSIKEGVLHQSQARRDRAMRIAEKLEKLGIENVWKNVEAIAGDSVIGRPHFARFLVESGVCNSIRQAFSSYLGAGKTGDVKQFWAPYEKIITWVREAGGVAVLAHPEKYKLTRTKLSLLLDDFQDAGGEAMEVVSGKQSKDITEKLSRLCCQKNLLASVGSDFHQPGQSWSELGQTSALPGECKTVWGRWS
ncbi:MAG: PHP domain-containing protein [Gammaproteobacteria bacterium]|nr:PHP domain-containing protein [Gammaproteobacteria bacterium]